MTELPDLESIFFPNDDADHAADSCCLSLDRDFFEDDRAKWVEVRDEHLKALSVLSEQAATSAHDVTGWVLARPLLFAAHHATELALKTALLDYRAEWPRGRDGHSLQLLLDLDRSRNGERAPSRAWEDRLVQLLGRGWEAGRYPDDRSGSALFDEWCCVSASQLAAAVYKFAELVDGV